MKKKILIAFGLVLVVGGVALSGITLYVHNKYEIEMKKLLDSKVITVNTSDGDSVSTSDDSSLVDFTIEAVGEDQIIGEIDEGTPTISIPSLDITVPVVEGTDKQSLKLGAGKFDNSVNMGEQGNFAVAGHSSTIYNCIFNNLENIRLLDKIICTDEKGESYTYYVTDLFKTDPTNIGVVASSTDSLMTIVTCTEGGTRRFIVRATLMSDSELEDYKRDLKQTLVERAIIIADKYSDIDIDTYILTNVKATKIPYRINYCNFEEIDSFFKNYVINDEMIINDFGGGLN